MKKDNIKLSIFWVFSFLVIIFMMTLTAHAEDPSYFPMNQNDNNKFNQTTLNYIDTRFDTANNFVFVSYLGKSQSGASDLYCAFYWSKNSDESNKIYGEIKTNGYQFSLYPNPGASRQSFYYYNGSCTDYYDSQLNWNLITQNIDSSLYNTNKSYVTNFRIYRTNDSTSGTVLKYGPDPIEPLPAGAAIEPLPFIVPEYFTGETAPETVPPQVTINNYTWTTPPSFDNSSVINGIQSIKDTLDWLASNIHSEIANFISNLKSLIVYISETIQYYGNAIIETLNNLIQTFYNNMKSLVENISNQIEYIKEPLDQDVIWDNISTTSLVTNVNTVKTSLTSFQDAFTGVNEPNEYKIPIHLENLPSSWFGNQTTQYIDLGVINGTVKDGLRLFVWAMVTYGLVVTIFDSIANYINGGGDES